MDFILNTSSEYHDCIICWSKDAPVNCMKEYSYFISNCKCNAFFHDKCFKTWLIAEQSCPICRKKIYVNIIENNDTYIKIKKWYFIFLNYTFSILRIFAFVSIVNRACIIFYNILCIDYALDIYYNECNIAL